MTTTYNAYDKLYNNLKTTFAVQDENGRECTLGEIMLAKAAKKKAAVELSKEKNKQALTAVYKFISDKLTIKQTPAKEKTISSFPIRTSLSSLFSAVVTCSLILSCCIIGVRSLDMQGENIVKENTHYGEDSTNIIYENIEFELK